MFHFCKINTTYFALHRSKICHFQIFVKKKNIRLHRQNHRAMSSLVAVCQMTATSDKEHNFETCKSLIDTAKGRGAKMVFLPECFDLIGESRKESIELSEPIEGPLINKYREIASNHSLWLSLGGFHEKYSDEEKICNSHIVINDKGEIVATYRKIHLFDINVPGRVRMKESDYVIPGDRVVHPIGTPVGKIGLGICYDMRFPEFSLALTKAGAEILTFPSAFMQATGEAHWEALLRTRAIESQCYVIAAAQVGNHNSKRSSYGHAMIVDPWGCVISSCSNNGAGIAMAELNLDYTKNVREGMPVWAHRRPELYGDIVSPTSKLESLVETYNFGQFPLKSSQIFYRTQYSMAFVNRRPIIPGHVLVSPIRVAERICDLTPLEISDLFCCVQKVQKVMEIEHKASSSTIAVQDGPDAGQSVHHVHVHICPRIPGDLIEDEIYVKLQTHDKKKDKQWRTDEDMTTEAMNLRKYFCSSYKI